MFLCASKKNRSSLIILQDNELIDDDQAFSILVWSKIVKLNKISFCKIVCRWLDKRRLCAKMDVYWCISSSSGIIDNIDSSLGLLWLWGLTHLYCLSSSPTHDDYCKEVKGSGRRHSLFLFSCGRKQYLGWILWHNIVTTKQRQI